MPPRCVHRTRSCEPSVGAISGQLAQAMLTDPAMIYWLDGQAEHQRGSKRKPCARDDGAVLPWTRKWLLREGRQGRSRFIDRPHTLPRRGWSTSSQHCTTSVRSRFFGLTGPLDGWHVSRGDSRTTGVPAVCRRQALEILRVRPRTSETRVGSGCCCVRPGPRPSRRRSWPFLFDPQADRRRTVPGRPTHRVVGRCRASLAVPGERRHLRTYCCQWLLAVGQAPFAPPNVGGWPSGEAWLSTTGIAQRAAAAMAMAKTGDTTVIEQAATKDRVDAVGYLFGIGAVVGHHGQGTA